MYMYYKLVEKPLSVYPPAAAAQVKEALYHASRGDVARMATAFKEAIRYAEESGMHPLSNEVAGLKIECAQLLLTIRDGELAGKAVAVLEHVLDENAAGAEYFAQQGRWADRTNVLKRAVLLGYKIGEIYQQLGKDPDAEEAMVWSTETLLKEASRREDRRADAAKEGDWFDDVAMSACFESSLPSPHSPSCSQLTVSAMAELAGQYDRMGQHYLATPLYLKAITLVPPNSCHTITLMNNLAASLARQQQTLVTAKEGRQAADLLGDAQRWAQKALDIDSTVKPPARTDECDRACVAATHTLGEIARLLGDRGTAQRRFDEARSLAHGLGMAEGIQAADEGLKNVEKMPQ